ncbi:uncharacterized protein [Amphiura filiformis]|uniref:uncharacterized protein n=1 Tax=Amphiura filiformis TaxID=82378 RepID=UPI003B20C0AA
MNAQLGDDVNTWKPALGCHAVGALNDNGIRLLTFCLAHDLIVGSSLFPHKNIHKLTWNSPDVLKQQKKQLKFNSSNLSNRDILASFNATIGGKFNILAELDDTSDINKEWANFTDTVNSAAREHLGYRKGKQEEWISSESRDLISRRKRAKPSLGSDYQELNRQTRASLRNDKKAWRASQIRDVNGNIIKDEAARLQRWSEYFKGLLNADEPEETIDFSVFTQAEELNINMDPPVREEVDKALGLLKRNKAPGVDNITPEILKDGGDVIREWLLRICQHVWKNEVTPAEWGKGIILPLPKKGDLSYCSNNRGITLIDIAGKVFSTILLQRVKDEVDLKMRDNQAGFRKGRSCQDQIFSLNQIIEKCLDQQLPASLISLTSRLLLTQCTCPPCGKFSASMEYLPR